jgi:hypothetical protein
VGILDGESQYRHPDILTKQEREVRHNRERQIGTSIYSASLLSFFQAAGALARAAAYSCRRLAGKETTGTVDAGRCYFLQAGLSGVAAAPLLLCGYGAAYVGRDCDVRVLTLTFGRTLLCRKNRQSILTAIGPTDNQQFTVHLKKLMIVAVCIF